MRATIFSIIAQPIGPSTLSVGYANCSPTGFWPQLFPLIVIFRTLREFSVKQVSAGYCRPCCEDGILVQHIHRFSSVFFRVSYYCSSSTESVDLTHLTLQYSIALQGTSWRSGFCFHPPFRRPMLFAFEALVFLFAPAAIRGKGTGSLLSVKKSR